MLHIMADELGEEWILSFFARGLLDFESYLAKHAAFAEYCRDHE